MGDPLKDTSGPSLNILIKLMAVESLVFAPFFQAHTPNGEDPTPEMAVMLRACIWGLQQLEEEASFCSIFGDGFLAVNRKVYGWFGALNALRMLS